MKNLKFLVALVAIFFSTLSFAAPVNINTASADEMAKALTGIGESKSKAIVEYRTTNGEFSSPDQIMRVRGINTGIFEKNKADILIK